MNPILLISIIVLLAVSVTWHRYLSRSRAIDKVIDFCPLKNRTSNEVIASIKRNKR